MSDETEALQEEVSADTSSDENISIGDVLSEDDENITLKAVYDIPVEVSAVLGKASMQISQLLKLGRGAVVELNRKIGEPVDVYVNDRLVARGEVVIIENKIGITMTEIIKPEKK